MTEKQKKTLFISGSTLLLGIIATAVYRSAKNRENSVALPLNVLDDVELNLSNWDSLMTRGVSDLLKEVPFKKVIKYSSKS